MATEKNNQKVMGITLGKNLSLLRLEN